jgi:glucosamine-6-phosphate deaminase
MTAAPEASSLGLDSSAVTHQAERIPAHAYPSSVAASHAVATEIAALIRDRAAHGRQVVLGLATGSTPVGVYEELVRLHREEGLSFANVVTFNLDEYWPMQPDELQSYHRFMHEYLFDQVDIDPSNVHIPDGTIAATRRRVLPAYEQKIADAGGIDLQILGIGRTGHIGFNEPGSPRDSRTRLITLDKVTRIDAASDFFGEWNVPRKAITMGVGTILDAGASCSWRSASTRRRSCSAPSRARSPSTVAASLPAGAPDARFVLDPARPRS